MNDAKGRPLSLGDTVFIPCKVTRLNALMPNANDLELESLGTNAHGRFRQKFNSVDGGQVYRANAGDDVTIATEDRQIGTVMTEVAGDADPKTGKKPVTRQAVAKVAPFLK